jgi:hypothetical protein
MFVSAASMSYEVALGQSLSELLSCCFTSSDADCAQSPPRAACLTLYASSALALRLFSLQLLLQQ